MTGYKLKVRLPDGRMKFCGCATRDKERYDAIRAWVQSLKHGKTRRIDVLEAIVVRGVPLADAYDNRHDLEQVLGLTAVRDLEPYVDKWHKEKSESRKGGSSADKYRRQVRELIPEGKAFLASRFTAAELRTWLRGLQVQDPTRNRYKAALASFADYLVDERVLERNPVSDIKGWSEGEGREEYYELDEAKALLERLEQPWSAIVALAVGGGLERQALQRLRVRDVDLAKKTVFANGGKTRWRRRLCRIVWDWCLPYVKEALRNKLPDALVFGEYDDHALHAAIAKAAEAAKISVLTLHDQRHTHAVGMLRDGYRPTVVAHQLGHSNTSLVWKRYGRHVVDERDYELVGAAKAAREAM